MAEHQPFAARRVQAHRHQRGHAADEPIHQHHDAFLGAGQVGADQRGYFKTAEIEQGLQRITALAGVQRQGAFNDCDLMADPCGIQTGARACEVSDLAIQQCAGQGTGGSGIADAHLTADKELRAAFQGTACAVSSSLQGQLPLGLGHRRAMHEISRARTDIQVTNAGQIQGRRDRAEVNHLQLRLQLPRQHADRRATGDEVLQHLPGDLLGKCRHAFSDHTVIAGKNRDPQVIYRRFDLALQTRQPHRQGFQLAEGTGGLGQLLLTRQRLFVGRGIHRLAGVEPPGIGHNAVPFKVRGRPATVSTTR